MERLVPDGVEGPLLDGRVLSIQTGCAGRTIGVAHTFFSKTFYFYKLRNKNLFRVPTVDVLALEVAGLKDAQVEHDIWRLFEMIKTNFR